MTLVDDRGRLFGRFNLFDAFVIGFAIVLIPIAYGTFLLFRAPQPTITAVKRVEITKEERRVGGPGLTAKLKVQGSGLRPMLRAMIGAAPAIGFVFENPNSADVLVGAVPPGSQDLVLYDGVQEVARAPQAVRLQRLDAPRLRIVGTLVALDKPTADALRSGASYPEGSHATTVVQLGPVRPDRRRLLVGSGSVELPIGGLWARDAVVSVACDPDPAGEDCTIAGKSLAVVPPPTVSVSGPSAPMSIAVSEALPDTPPQSAVVRVRFEGSREIVDLIKAGDRDVLLDERAAVAAEIGRRQTSDAETLLDVTLRLGADASPDGWRYRGHDLKPGQPFTLNTSNYVASGFVLSVSVADNGAQKASKP